MASGHRRSARTVAGMRGHNHVDGRLKLRPCDYLDPPQQFGTNSNARVVVPPGGDPRSAEAAVHQHRLVMAWRSDPTAPNGAELGRRYQVSRQTVSRTIRGERWCGQVLMTALLTYRPTRNTVRRP